MLTVSWAVWPAHLSSPCAPSPLSPLNLPWNSSHTFFSSSMQFRISPESHKAKKLFFFFFACYLFCLAVSPSFFWWNSSLDLSFRGTPLRKPFSDPRSSQPHLLDRPRFFSILLSGGTFFSSLVLGLGSDSISLSMSQYPLWEPPPSCWHPSVRPHCSPRFPLKFKLKANLLVTFPSPWSRKAPHI